MFIFVKSFVWTLIYSVSFFLFYNQVYRPLGKYPSDLNSHISFINHIDLIAHPLWHYTVKLISSLLNVSLQHSAILFTALLVVLIFMIINKILEYALKNELLSLTTGSKQYILLFVSLALLISSAIYFPFLDTNFLLGRGSSGVWHNVTLLMVKPFAFLSMFFSVLYIQQKNMKFFFFSILLTITSIFAKPSYIIIFLPSFYLFILYYIHKQQNTTFKNLFNLTRILNKYKYIFIYLVTITFASISILIIQFLMTYGGGENTANSKIIFDFLGVWSQYSPNIFISLLLTTLFPLLVMVFVPNTKSNFYILSLIMFIISIIMYACFAEGGPRYSDGNFGWSLQISYHIFFLFSTVEFLKRYHILANWKKYLLSIILSLHIISGLFYLGKILNGLSYV